MQFGVAVSTIQTVGLMGVGYTNNEASSPIQGSRNSTSTGEQLPKFTYASIIDHLVSNASINIAAYSIWLDDLESSTGSILFGALDTDKFQGELQELAIVPDTFLNGTQVYHEFTVALTGLAVSDSIAKTTAPILDTGLNVTVILDSGSAFTTIPQTLLDKLDSALGGVQVFGYTAVDCALKTDKPGITVDYSFPTTGTETSTINVPVSEVVLPLSILSITQDMLQLALGNQTLPFTDVCILGIVGAEKGPYILGDTFIRSAYVVYDLKNNLIGLANTNLNSTTSNIVEFEADQTKLPQASGVATSSAATGTTTPASSNTSTVPKSTKTGAGSTLMASNSIGWVAAVGGSMAMAYFMV